MAPPFPQHFHYKVLQVMDVPWENLGKHFSEAVRFIKGALASGGKVFVHCWAGRSRSSSCVIADLMQEHGMSLNAAYGLCK